MNILAIKQRFDIVGNSPSLNKALDLAIKSSTTDMSVLINGQSGVGKEIIPKIIHSLSKRKHSKYIAVNCGAIPEGTIDAELFGHEKGAFTGALETRKGFFGEANGGTIFLDEVGELPLSTQVRLLRVLETGEFFKVGSSVMEKTDVRIVAATNINFGTALRTHKFREDLYYRLSSIPIHLPPLRERKEDIYALFRKFASDYGTKYNMPTISLSPEARIAIENFSWPGNIRQLKNITERLSLFETSREISIETVKEYLSSSDIISSENRSLVDNFSHQKESDLEILYKMVFQLRKELDEVKTAFLKYIDGDADAIIPSNLKSEMTEIKEISNTTKEASSMIEIQAKNMDIPSLEIGSDINSEPLPEIRSIEEVERQMISRALSEFPNNKKKVAELLGFSERTLYRKLKEYNIET